MTVPKPRTASRAARIAAGFSLKEAAARAGRSAKYLGQLERSNRFPLQLAIRLSRIYGCRIDLFHPRQPGGAARRPEAGPVKWDSPGRRGR